MSASSPAAWRGTLAGLIAFHIFIIIASNYLVQLPITLFGWHTTWAPSAFRSSSWLPTSPCACWARALPGWSSPGS
ncbi:Inner membrane protein yhhQ [Pseudomonas aeruginosa PA38182]|nr:Inner membrane protein yhhQ [Pseudomonas aeruginosa PA38182]